MARISLLLLLLSIHMLLASPVAPAKAYAVARSWLQNHRSDRQMAPLSTSTQSASSYLFSLQPRGWIMVAGEDTAEPILGYSFVSSYRADKLPPEFAYWRKKVRQTIERTKSLSSTTASTAWQRLSSPASRRNAKLSAGSTKQVLPLLKTTWGQGEHYNDWCPSDSASVYDNGHDPVGCVATAMTQIMRYHQWPDKGAGEHAGTRFGRATYLWSQMPEGNVTSTNDEVAEISSHAGVAVDMMYGPYGSGAYPEAIANALTRYFRYNVSGGLTASDSMSSAQWHAALQQDLDQGLPILYGGYDDHGYGGHAFVCDGYRVEGATPYYHFNWGWDGELDGWFRIGALNPGDDGYQLNTETLAVLGIAPDRTVERPTITKLDATHLYMSRATGQWAGRGLTEGSGVTILGDHFGVKPGAVYFASQHAKTKATVTSWSDTNITVNVPDGAQSTLYVVLSDGKTTSNTLHVTAWQRGADTGCRHEGAAAIVYGQEIYAFGDTYRSACSERYNPKTDTWTPINDDGGETRWPGVTATLYNGKVYLFRAWMNTDDNRTRVYDLGTQAWSYAAPIPGNLRNGAGAVVEGILYYLGGKVYNEHSTTTGVYAYDAAHDSWGEDGNFTTPRAEFTATAIYGKIHLFGQGLDADFSAAAEAYDPHTHHADSIANMPLPMRTPGATIQGGTITLLSGEVDDFSGDEFRRTPPKVFTYKPTEDTWELQIGSIQEPPVPFVQSQFLYVGKKLVSVGGSIKGSSGTDEYKQTWYLNPPNHLPTAPKKSFEKKLEQGSDPIRISAYTRDEIADADNDALQIAITYPPHGGTVTIDGLTLVYTPDPEYHGIDTFRYRIQDAQQAMSVNESTATLRVQEAGGGKGDEGSTGGGCSYNPHAKGIDALMVLMILAALLYPLRRRYLGA